MPDSRPARILVVDDEADLELLIRQRFRRQIRANEMDFCFAQNGQDALDVLREDDAIEVILTDLNMPVMDGLTLLLRLGEQDRLLRAVVVSAYGDMDNLRKAMNRGAFDFVTKPIDFEDLEVTINKTLDLVQDLRQAADTEKQLRTIQHDLEVARRIQESIIPRTFPAFPDRPEFDLYGDMIPAREVGGDFYDFFLIDDERLGLVIADVADKGIAAALFMAVSRTLMRATAMMGGPANECLTQVNDVLSRENTNAMFVTLFYAILHARTGQIQYSDGGHNPPFIVRKDGSVERIEKVGSVALGWMPGVRYPAGSLALSPGDALFLYTDGVTEAKNPAHELFSETRLADSLARTPPTDLQALVQQVNADVRAHAGTAEQSDDITILAARYDGA